MSSHATVCDVHPRKNASHLLSARATATKSGSNATKISQPMATFGNAKAKATPEVIARRNRTVILSEAKDLKLRILRCFAVFAAQHDGLSFLEQRVERFARIVGRLRRARFVGGEIPHDPGREERALVAGVLAGDACRDVLAALPQRRGVEEAAVAAGVEVGAAVHAGLVGGGVLQSDPLRAALVALEDLRAEAAGGAPARRSLEALRTLLGPRRLRPLLLVAARVRVSAAVLIALMSVFAIAHIHLMN